MRKIILQLFLCLVTLPLWAGSAKIVDTRGFVRVTPPKGKEVKALAGQELAPGTRIRTGKNSGAELHFKNGSVLKIRPNTSMSLSGYKRTASKKQAVLLFFGRLWNRITKAKRDGYEVKTPNAVCGVRGTEFETAVADDGSLRVRVQKGSVVVSDEGDPTHIGPGHQIDASEQGVGQAQASSGDAKWQAWEKEKRTRLIDQPRGMVDHMKNRIMRRKAKIESLRARQRDIEKKRIKAEHSVRSGNRAALDSIRGYNAELAQIADAIADLGDEAASQIGLVDHYADLANDPRFASIDRKYLVGQAASLRRIKADLDKMVAEGTDLSIESMDAMLDDLSGGSRGTLKGKKGSSADDMFGPNEIDMR